MLRKRITSILFSAVFLIAQSPIQVFADDTSSSETSVSTNTLVPEGTDRANFIPIGPLLPIITGAFQVVGQAGSLAGPLLQGAFNQLQQGSFNLQNLVGGAASGICNNLVSSFTTSISNFTGPLMNYVNIASDLSNVQDLQGLASTFADVTGVSLAGPLQGVQDRLGPLQSLQGFVSDPDKLTDALYSMAEGKVVGALQSNERIGGLINLVQGGENRLSGLNGELQGLVGDLGNPDVIGTVTNMIGQSELGAQIDNITSRIDSLDSIANSYASDLLPELTNVDGLISQGISMGNLDGALNQITSLKDQAQGTIDGLSGQLTSKTALLTDAETSLDALTNLPKPDMVAQFQPTPALPDEAENLAAAAQNFADARVQQVGVVQDLRSQVGDIEQQIGFHQDKLGKMTELLNIGQIPDLPIGDLGNTLLSATEGYREDIDGSIDFINSTTQSLQGSVGRLQDQATEFLQGQLPIDQVLEKVAFAEGELSSFISTKVQPLQDLAGSALNSFTELRESALSGISTFQNTLSGRLDGALDQVTSFLPGGDFLGSLDDRLGVLNSQIGAASDALNAVVGPVQDAFSDITSASGICNIALSELGDLFNSFNFESVEGFVGDFFNNAQADLGEAASGLLDQIGGSQILTNLCDQVKNIVGAPVPSLGCLAIVVDDAPKAKAKKKRKKKRKKLNLKRCCRLYPGEIPQCTAKRSLQCVAPSSDIRSNRKGKQCFKKFTKRTKQCVKKGGITDEQTLPLVEDYIPAQEQLDSVDDIQTISDGMSRWQKDFMNYVKAVPERAVDEMYNQIMEDRGTPNPEGYSVSGEIESYTAEIEGFINDPRYAQYRD